MDSLLASYASSDEEDDQQQQQPLPRSATSSSLFSSLPKPHKPHGKELDFKQQQQQHVEIQNSKPQSLFSALPAPKSQPTPNATPTPNPKRVVPFRVPIPQPPPEEDNDEEEENERNKKRQLVQDTTSFSVKSFLSSMPTPKNSASSTLGPLPGSSASYGRRSIIEADVPGPLPVPSCSDDAHGGVPGMQLGINYQVGVDGDQSFVGSDAYGNASGYESYSSYGGYDSSSSLYDNNSFGVIVPDSLPPVESFVNSVNAGKRRKDQTPTEIVEVRQDELIKNRPREDQSKLTGIAFGPSYQPASSKGKPSKLHKRKHQIGSLYHEMRQKEMELAERRAKGFLTKAETQAKYGW